MAKWHYCWLCALLSALAALSVIALYTSSPIGSRGGSSLQYGVHPGA